MLPEPILCYHKQLSTVYLAVRIRINLVIINQETISVISHRGLLFLTVAQSRAAEHLVMLCFFSSNSETTCTHLSLNHIHCQRSLTDYKFRLSHQYQLYKQLVYILMIRRKYHSASKIQHIMICISGFCLQTNYLFGALSNQFSLLEMLFYMGEFFVLIFAPL